MARARAEIVKLEALEKIAAAHQHQLQRKARRTRHRGGAAVLPPRSQAGLRPAGAAAARPAAAGQEAEEAAAEPLGLPAVQEQAAAEVAEEAAEEAEEAEASEGGAAAAEEERRAALLEGGISTTTLELFSVITRMREALQESMAERLAQRQREEGDATLPVSMAGGDGGARQGYSLASSAPT